MEIERKHGAVIFIWSAFDKPIGRRVRVNNHAPHVFEKFYKTLTHFIIRHSSRTPPITLHLSGACKHHVTDCTAAYLEWIPRYNFPEITNYYSIAQQPLQSFHRPLMKVSLPNLIVVTIFSIQTLLFLIPLSCCYPKRTLRTMLNLITKNFS